MLTPADLARLQQLHEKATPGPWKRVGNDGRKNQRIESETVVPMDRPDKTVASLHVTAWKIDKRDARPDAEMLVQARNYLPDLLALAALGLRVQEMREALEALRIDANRLCDRQLGGTYEDDCRRSITRADKALALARLDTGQER